MGTENILILGQRADRAILELYADIPIAFRVTRRYAVSLVGTGGLGGLALTEEPVASSYVKDYDDADGAGPTGWGDRFDISRWGILCAFDGAEMVGGVAVVCDAPDIEMLGGRCDLGLVWDLRVRPAWRGWGVGRRLFAAAEAWAQARGCGEIIVETQNINVDACRFYAARGCVLRTIRQGAYPDLPDEVQLIWHKSLAR